MNEMMRNKIVELFPRARDATAAPLVEPAEAIAIALSVTQPGPARLISPDGPMVANVLLALKLAGWKIEPA